MTTNYAVAYFSNLFVLVQPKFRTKHSFRVIWHYLIDRGTTRSRWSTAV